MAGFKNHKAVIDAYNEGRYRVSAWRKSPTLSVTQGIWYDLSMSPGNPSPQYYAAAPLSSKALSRSQDGGIDHGAPITPQTKFLHKFMLLSATGVHPLNIIIQDYLLYYPFVDMSTTDEQAMTQVDTLPRYTDYEGIQIMPVQVASQVGGAQFFVTYTNQDGVAGRVTPTVTCNTLSVVGTIITSNRQTGPFAGGTGPYLPLQDGDSGVQSIQSLTMLTADVGLITLVLVKPLASMSLYDNTAPAERDFIIDGLQRTIIKDDAYLNIVTMATNIQNNHNIFGTIETIWN